jgi:nucleoside diphosphate kinase
MKIVVGGYIIGYPLGGMTWHHLNYLLGLHELGHEVVFLEDSGSWSLPYNPATWTCDVDSTYGREYLQRTLQQYGLPIRWCYYSQFEDRHYGLSGRELDDALAEADLLLCVSGVTPLRPQRPRPRRTCVIDTDPVFTQLRMWNDAQFLGYYRSFDAVATFGRLIGTPACPLPTHGLRWLPTNQPISLAHWPVADCPGDAFTTIGKWEHTSDRHITYDGRRYYSSKSVEWLKLIELPRRVHLPLRLAMQGMPGDVRQRFEDNGWHIVDAESASMDCAGFRRFVQDSAGELTVAKQLYAALPSGWFSDRSAAYLASGRPVVTQSTGFEQWLPVGKGLMSFHTPDEAAEALQAIAGDYAAHARVARNICEACFDARKVLIHLLEQIV